MWYLCRYRILISVHVILTTPPLCLGAMGLRWTHVAATSLWLPGRTISACIIYFFSATVCPSCILFLNPCALLCTIYMLTCSWLRMRYGMFLTKVSAIRNPYDLVGGKNSRPLLNPIWYSSTNLSTAGLSALCNWCIFWWSHTTFMRHILRSIP